MNTRLLFILATLLFPVVCANAQHAKPYVSERQLQYVPTRVELALWRKPVEYTAWPGRGRPPVFFSKPEADSGTTHSMAVVGEFEYGGRKIAIAVDSEDVDVTTPTGVRVDMSGKGDFRDAELLPLGPGGGVKYEYGQAVVPLELDGTTVPFMVWGRYDRWTNGRIIQFDGYLATEGPVEIAGRDYPVRIIDSSKNWKLGDKPQPEWGFQPYFSGDSLAIETGDGNFENPETVLKVWYGQPVEIDGRLYDIHLTEDGKELRAPELPAGKVGLVRVAGAKSFWGILISKNYVLNVSSGEDAAALVPAGEYIVHTIGAGFTEGGSVETISDRKLPETIVVPPDGTVEIKVAGRQ